MMESCVKFYGKYAELEWREAAPKWVGCTCCGRESQEFLIDANTNEIVGCTECTTSNIAHEERYMVDVEDAVYLQCPRCGELCDTLFAEFKNPEWVDGCDNCLKWVDAFAEED